MAKQERLREAKQHGAAWFPFNIYPCTIPKDFPQVALHWQDSMELVFVKRGSGLSFLESFLVDIYPSKPFSSRYAGRAARPAPAAR